MPRYLMTYLFCRIILVVAALTLMSPSCRGADDRMFELRIYVTEPGRMDALLARFRDHTCRLFEKHGMENIGYWVPLDADKGSQNTLIYIIAHKSQEAAGASWAAFLSDPQWKEAQKKSEESGKILSQPPESIFMKGADFSPVIKPGVGKASRVFELRDYTTPEGKIGPLDARFRDHTVKLFEKHGMENVGYWHPTDAAKGAGSRLLYVLAHPNKEQGLASFKAFGADPDWQAARSASEKSAGGPLTVKGGVKSTYMKAVDFSPIR